MYQQCRDRTSLNKLIREMCRGQKRFEFSISAKLPIRDRAVRLRREKEVLFSDQGMRPHLQKHRLNGLLNQLFLFLLFHMTLRVNPVFHAYCQVHD